MLWSLGVDCSFSTLRLRPLWLGDNVGRLNWVAHWHRWDVDFKVFGQVPSEEVLGEHGHPDVKLCLAINIFMSASSRCIPSLSSWSNGDSWLFLEFHRLRYHLQRAFVGTKWDKHVVTWWVKKGHWPWKCSRMLGWKDTQLGRAGWLSWIWKDPGAQVNGETHLQSAFVTFAISVHLAISMAPKVQSPRAEARSPSFHAMALPLEEVVSDVLVGHKPAAWLEGTVFSYL